MQTNKDDIILTVKAYSLVEILVTLAIFGVLSMMLGQTLLSNLSLSARLSARAQIRSNIDLSLSLMERDFRNADSLGDCGTGAPVISFGTPAQPCKSYCKMEVGSKDITWCFVEGYGDKGNRLASNSIAGDRFGTLSRWQGIEETFQSAALLNYTGVNFIVNNSQSDAAAVSSPLSFANIMVTVEVHNADLNIFDQVKQQTITTRNYSIK